MAETIELQGNIRNLSGVTVQLYDIGVSGVINTVHSDSLGKWKFDKPAPGKYNVLFEGRGTSEKDTIYGIEIVGEPGEIDKDLTALVKNRGAGDGVIKSSAELEGIARRIRVLTTEPLIILGTGEIYYNSTTKKIGVYTTGTGWVYTSVLQ